MVFELARSVMTGNPFAGIFRIKRRSGVLLIAAEGSGEVPSRLEGMLKEKADGFDPPFEWCEEIPATLLADKAADRLAQLVAEADRDMQRDFGVPLGLIVIDTLIVTAGYQKPGEENDAAVGTRVMNVLHQVARRAGVFVLGVDHFGKVIETGTRGTSVKETNADMVIALTGKQDDGQVPNPEMQIRKVRGARSGQTFAFTAKDITIGTDEDGDTVETKVIVWGVEEGAGARPRQVKDWPKPLRLLQRIMVEIVTAEGREIEIEGSKVRAIDREAVRPKFYAKHPADGDTEAKRQHAHKMAFRRAVEGAQAAGLIDIAVHDGATMIWLKDA
jgi:hypothetical protein